MKIQFFWWGKILTRFFWFLSFSFKIENTYTPERETVRKLLKCMTFSKNKKEMFYCSFFLAPCINEFLIGNDDDDEEK